MHSIFFSRKIPYYLKVSKISECTPLYQCAFFIYVSKLCHLIISADKAMSSRQTWNVTRQFSCQLSCYRFQFTNVLILLTFHCHYASPASMIMWVTKLQSELALFWFCIAIKTNWKNSMKSLFSITILL